MKIFSLFLLTILLANSISSLPTDSTEEEEDASAEEEPQISSTTSTATTSTTQTIPTTTAAPIPKINVEIEELIEKVSTRFNDLRVTFLKNQQIVYDKVKLDIENYKALRDASVDIFKKAYEQELAELNGNLKFLEAKKSETEKLIEKIYEDSLNNDEKTKKLKALNARKKLLTDMKSQNCEDCGGFLDENQIDALLQEIDKKIADLEEKIEKQKSDSEIRNTRLNDEETRQLNSKYVELIYIYQKEIEELKKKEKLELLRSIENDKWKKYAETIGDLHTKVEASIEKLTKNSLRVSKLTSNESAYYSDDWSEFNVHPDSYKWIPIDKHTDVPSNAVSGGEDSDGSVLYIIRTMKDERYLYGKYAVSSSRNDPYVTNSDVELVPSSFEILTSKNYTWCDLKTYKVRDNTPSVCTTTHYYESAWSSVRKEATVPGTLLKDGKCRIGFAWGVHTYTENVKVLGFGSCGSNESALKFWF